MALHVIWHAGAVERGHIGSVNGIEFEDVPVDAEQRVVDVWPCRLRAIRKHGHMYLGRVAVAEGKGGVHGRREDGARGWLSVTRKADVVEPLALLGHGCQGLLEGGGHLVKRHVAVMRATLVVKAVLAVEAVKGADLACCRHEVHAE